MTLKCLACMSAHSCVSMFLSFIVLFDPESAAKDPALASLRDGSEPVSGGRELWPGVKPRLSHRQCLRPPIKTQCVYVIGHYGHGGPLRVPGWSEMKVLRSDEHLRRMKCQRWKVEKRGWFYFCVFVFDHLDTTFRSVGVCEALLFREL